MIVGGMRCKLLISSGSFVTSLFSVTESVDRKGEPVSNVLSLSCIPRAAHNAARTTGSQWSLGHVNRGNEFDAHGDSIRAAHRSDTQCVNYSLTQKVASL